MGGPFYRDPAPDAEAPSLPRLEATLFPQVGATPPAPVPLDLMVGCIAAIAVTSFGFAWYLAYTHGLLREKAIAGSLPGTVIVTTHPSYIGIVAVVLLLGALSLWALLAWLGFGDWVRARAERLSRPLGRLLPAARMVTAGALVVALTVAVNLAVGWALTRPLVHSDREPLLGLRAAPVSISSLAAEPIISFTMFCRPAPCQIVKAAVHVPVREPFADQPRITVDMPETLPPLRLVPLDGPARVRLRRRVAALRRLYALPLRLPRRVRFGPPHVTTTRMFADVPPRRRALARVTGDPDEVPQTTFAIRAVVLDARAARRILDTAGRSRVVPLPSTRLDLRVQFGRHSTRPINLPLPVLVR
jgi:hypothetical protein